MAARLCHATLPSRGNGVDGAAVQVPAKNIAYSRMSDDQIMPAWTAGCPLRKHLRIVIGKTVGSIRVLG
jgi:hypothetical protein